MGATKVDDYETPMRVGTQFSEFLCEGEQQIMKLSFLGDSPIDAIDTGLASALTRSLSQKNDDLLKLREHSVQRLGDLCDESPRQVTALFAQNPA